MAGQRHPWSLRVRPDKGSCHRPSVLHRSLLVLTATATVLLMLHQAPTVQADILVYQMLNDQIIEEFRDLPATFGGEIPDTGMKVLADRAVPADGCNEMRKKPANNTILFAVVIARYNCSFEVKVRNAQQAGYSLAIVYNVGSNDLEHMSASHPQDLLIPSVFVGENSGRSIIEAYTYEHDYALVITDDIPFNISNNLFIPFAIVIGLCFIIMRVFIKVLFMIIRCIRERRRTLRNRLPARLLKRIGTVKFAKGMQFDTCAICLDDFVENERLRVLPCRHAYHTQCIDPWLTKNRRVCPICKRKVIVRGERRQPRRRWSSDSMSSSDPDETTPLLNSSSDSANQTPAAAAAAAPAPVPAVTVAPASSSSSNLQQLAGGGTANPPGAAIAPSSLAAAAAVGVIQTSPRRTWPNEAFRLLLEQEAPSRATANAAAVATNDDDDDDDELLDDRNVPNAAGGGGWFAGGLGGGQGQQHPINESPYSPIGDEATLSRWQRFKRLFTGAPADESDEHDVEASHTPAPVAAAAAAATGPTAIGSSNNILNVHLAGSFHGSEDTTDDELLGAMQRDLAKRRQFRSAPDMPSTSVGSSGGGRVGVAALPNVNFNPDSTAAAVPWTLGVGGRHPGRTAGTPRRSRPRGSSNGTGGGRNQPV